MPTYATYAYTETIGILAAMCTTTAYLPQLIKVLRAGSAESISIAMYSLMSFGLGLWLTYGVFLHSNPIIVANAVTLLFTLSILFVKIKKG